MAHFASIYNLPMRLSVGTLTVLVTSCLFNSRDANPQSSRHANANAQQKTL